MAKIKDIEHKIHVLTIVIKRQKDIPLVRTKAKILANICGFVGMRRAQIAILASEMARIILKETERGTVSFFVVCSRDDTDFSGSGILLEFVSTTGREIFSRMNERAQNLLKLLQKIPDQFMHSHERHQVGLVEVLFWGGMESCRDIENSHELIKKRLFSDMEESYLESLRAKHEEVLRLLRTISVKNKELDKVNAELLELSRDMEGLVHERTVVEFALRIADKIRNPATVIGGLASILLKHLSGNSDVRTKVEAILAQAQKLEEIVRDFEGLAREQENFFSQTSLKELVVETVQAWESNFQKKDIAVKIHLPEEDVMVRANPRLLKVALLHILKNALDASPEGSMVEITLSRLNGRPYIEIKDYGPGIDEKIKDKLFKELVTTKPSGTGIGLIMVRHIMTEHQGTIDIDSMPGLGTAVRLIFPVRWKE